jgi:hypothetical protein
MTVSSPQRCRIGRVLEPTVEGQLVRFANSAVQQCFPPPHPSGRASRRLSGKAPCACRTHHHDVGADCVAIDPSERPCAWAVSRNLSEARRNSHERRTAPSGPALLGYGCRPSLIRSRSVDTDTNQDSAAVSFDGTLSCGSRKCAHWAE